MRSARLALPLCLGLAACGPATPDMGLHMGAGGLAYTAQSALLPHKMRATPLHRCALATVAGVAKEAYDATGRGTPELRDVGNTVIGCLVLDMAWQAIRGRHIWTGAPRG